LSAARRQKLHLEVAGAIERSCSATLADYYGELAHHYRLGGNLAKAIAYLVQAARQAVARSAPQQAIMLATTGLELLAAIPNDEQHDRDELALQMTLGNCAGITRGWAAPEAERAYARALELCGRTDLTPAAIRALTGLYIYYSRGANYHRASALQVQLLELAPALAEPQLRAVIHYSIGFRLLYHGDFEAARNQLEQATRWSAGHRRHVHASAAMALTLWNLGYPAQASKLIKEAGTEGRKLHDPYAEVMVADNACMVHLVSKDAPGAKLYADDLTNTSTKYGFAGEIAVARIVHAWADGWGGDPKGIDLLRESLVEFAAAEGELSRSWLCGLIAELCLKFGRNDEAVAALEEAIGVIARTGEGFAESEIYRLKGEAELQLGHSEIGCAAKWFERAIDAARKRSARIAELRATSNLARLLAKQHKHDKARVMLAEIYNWFTEGFDTADLKDAKALLDQLNA
jgi:tetratricopeptide (TPR) repeat protein